MNTVIIQQNKKTGKLKIIKHSKTLAQYAKKSEYFAGFIGENTKYNLYAVDIKGFKEVTE